jgi:hypothetical protein
VNVKSVVVNWPENRDLVYEKYTEVVAKITVDKIGIENIDPFISRLREIWGLHDKT